MQSKKKVTIKSLVNSVKGIKSTIVRKPNLTTISIPKFPSHVKLTEKRRKKKKEGEGKGEMENIPNYTKINGQYLYNGGWNAFQRKKVFDALHSFIKDSIEQGLEGKKLSLSFPVNIELEIHTVKWHGGIKVVKGQFQYPTEVSPGNSNWDIGNLGFAWTKAIDDCLSDLGIIPDDSIDYVRSTGKVTFVPVDKYEDRKLVIKIEKSYV